MKSGEYKLIYESLKNYSLQKEKAQIISYFMWNIILDVLFALNIL